MESVTLGVKLCYLGVEISREIIREAIGVGGIGNFGGEIMVSGGGNFKGNHRSSYRSRWNR